MTAAWTVLVKDLRQRLRDRSAYLFAVVAPLGLAIVLSAVVGGTIGDGPSFRFAAVDEDGGPLARAFVEDVLGDLEADGIIELEVTRGADARAAVEDGDVGAALIVPAGFSDAVLAGEPAEIEVVTDASRPIVGGVARAIAERFASSLRSVQVAVASAVVSGAPEAEVAALVERAAAVPDPIVLRDQPATARQLDPATYFSAGMAVFFLFFTVQFGITGLLEERQHGTLARLLASPISARTVVGGKVLTSLVLGIVSMLALVVGTSLTVGASWGDPLGVAVLVVATVFAATGIMAVIATFARTVEQANTAQSITAVVLGMVGGAFFPVAQGPGLLADLSLVVPHRWFMIGLENLAGDGAVADVIGPVGAILAFAAAGFGFALIRMKRLVV